MKHFKASEFDCKCGCGQNRCTDKFFAMIDDAREKAGVPFIINSGYRCLIHNKHIGSTTLNHPSGNAADIKAEDMWTRLLVIIGLVMAGFKHIGIDKTFIHADCYDAAPKGLYLY